VPLLVAALVWSAGGPFPGSLPLHAAAAQETDTDGDTLPDAWETFFGLNPDDPSDAIGDPDADGLTNAQEFAARRHPVGRHTRYFAEGSTGFFDTSVAVLNLSTTATAHVALALLNENGAVVSHQLTLGPRQRQTVSINAVLGVPAAVAIIVESDVPVAADRWMTWGTSGTGASLDSGAPTPATTWYFAEGATGPFLLYYLFENPSTTPATVSVRYLVEGGSPVTTTHTLPPQSRTTIPVNQDDPALAVASTGSVITSDVPIFAERAMYVNAGGTLGGGSASAGSNQLATQWYFGEGATGPFFHAFLSLLNPGATAATATVTYHLQDGSTASKSYAVPAEGRRTVYFNGEAASDPALAALATGPVWFTVTSTQPILGERAMWWSEWPWYEGHAAPGSTTSALSWAVPEGRHGGPTLEETYVLIGNTTTAPGQVRLTLIPDTGASSTQELPIGAGERLTVNIGNLFGLTEGRFSVIVDSLGSPATPLAVDYARYRSANGLAFSGGGAAPAIPIPPTDVAPSVLSTSPANGATDASSFDNLVVTFSEPVNVTPAAFALACPSSAPIALTNLTASPAAAFTLEPAVVLPAGTRCTLTIAAAAVTDADPADPPNTLAADVVVSFTTARVEITSAAAATFTAGSPGTFTVTTVGAPTPTLALSGTLPAGVTFTDLGDGTAMLAGTPAPGTAAAYPLTITAANPAGSATQAFTLTVQSAPAITSGIASTFTAGIPATFIVTTTGVPVPSLTASGTLPAGVTFVDNGNGSATLSGTPAAGTGGTYPLTFTATNSVGTSTPQAFTLTVNQAPAVTSASTTTFSLGVAGQSFTVTTAGFPTPTITTGALPAGITFVDNLNGTGTLSGTPAAGTAGAHTVTFTVTNGVGGPVVQAFTLNINQGPVITSASTAAFALGAANSFTVTASGFPAPSLVRAGAALPSGVTWVDNGNGTGTLSGTPGTGTGGTYALTFTASNSSGSAVQSFTLTVSGSPGFTSANTTTFTVGAAGSFQVTAVGTPTPALIVVGSLPSGMSFSDNADGTGTLSGTPAAGTGGVYSLTFTASNGLLPNAIQTFTLRVNEGPAITSAPAATFTAGTAGSFTVTTSGLPTPSLTISGTLPAGVTFVDNGNGTGTLSGTPAAGTGGIYTIAFTATNALGSSAPQAFVLNVNSTPALSRAISQ
jgi:hypothetical protein